MWLYCVSTRLEKARIAGLQSRRNCTPCDAWMHFAGGETSAGRSEITWMMFLTVFFCANEKAGYVFRTQPYPERAGRG